MTDEFVTVFAVDTTQGVQDLFGYFGFEGAVDILCAFKAFVSEFDDHGCQDSYRIRIVRIYDKDINNKTEYNALATCCGSTDREVELSTIPDYVLEFGCNYGH